MNSLPISHRFLYVFWFLPILLLPFTWVNALVQDAEILGTIQGTGFLVARNFPWLVVSYLVLSVSFLLIEWFQMSFIWRQLAFTLSTMFTTGVLLLPRVIIGPAGLSESGLRDGTSYAAMYFLAIRPAFYLVILSLLSGLAGYLFLVLIPAYTNDKKNTDKKTFDSMNR